MKVLLLAAGRGTRMLPLTANKPKCLLEVHGRSLIDHNLFALAKAGFSNIIINAAEWAKEIQQAVGDGARYGVSIHYSIEPHPLETAGSIFHALPLLGSDHFAVLNSDLWTDYPFAELTHKTKKLAHLVMVDNPAHHPQGDFCLHGGEITKDVGTRLTYAGIGVYHPQLFANCQAGVYPLRTAIIEPSITKQQVSGEHYRGLWIDVGTPARLQLVNDHY